MNPNVPTPAPATFSEALTRLDRLISSANQLGDDSNQLRMFLCGPEPMGVSSSGPVKERAAGALNTFEDQLDSLEAALFAAAQNVNRMTVRSGAYPSPQAAQNMPLAVRR